MMEIRPGLAKLAKAQIRKVQDLEGELDVILLAHEKMPALSELSKGELEDLRETEKKMGVTLVAYRRG
jgi:hypothetical protein